MAALALGVHMDNKQRGLKVFLDVEAHQKFLKVATNSTLTRELEFAANEHVGQQRCITRLRYEVTDLREDSEQLTYEVRELQAQKRRQAEEIKRLKQELESIPWNPTMTQFQWQADEIKRLNQELESIHWRAIDVKCREEATAGMSPRDYDGEGYAHGSFW